MFQIRLQLSLLVARFHLPNVVKVSTQTRSDGVPVPSAGELLHGHDGPLLHHPLDQLRIRVVSGQGRSSGIVTLRRALIGNVAPHADFVEDHAQTVQVE